MPKTHEEAIDYVCAIVKKTLVAKMRDYGPHNILSLGEKGVFVRVQDKVNRLYNLVWKGKAPQNETVSDTWIDIAGYGLIAMMLEHGIFGLPLQEDLMEDDDENNGWETMMDGNGGITSEP